MRDACDVRGLEQHAPANFLSLSFSLVRSLSFDLRSPRLVYQIDRDSSRDFAITRSSTNDVSDGDVSVWGSGREGAGKGAVSITASANPSSLFGMAAPPLVHISTKPEMPISDVLFINFYLGSSFLILYFPSFFFLFLLRRKNYLPGQIFNSPLSRRKQKRSILNVHYYSKDHLSIFFLAILSNEQGYC